MTTSSCGTCGGSRSLVREGLPPVSCPECVTQVIPPPSPAPLVTDRVATLEAKVAQLQTCVVGQAAMIALLSGILADKGVISRQDASIVAMAGISAKDYPNMNPAQVTEWVQREMSARRTRRGGSPRSS